MVLNFQLNSVEFLSLIDKLIGALPKRIISALIDQISLVIVFAVFSTVEEPIFALVEIKNGSVYTAIVFFSLFLNKDFNFGKSIGKAFTGLRVMSIRTGLPANPIQCCVRNLFLLLWPIEVLFILLYAERRLAISLQGLKW